ncbi:MAG: hypothetical protein Q4E17_00375 [Synergistes sp.]|nr:hypothetical protein [Synergistes sp.]
MQATKFSTMDINPIPASRPVKNLRKLVDSYRDMYCIPPSTAIGNINII